MPGQFTADRKRLQTDIDALAQFGKSGPTAITRLAFTKEDNEAHQHIEKLMREAGLVDVTVRPLTLGTVTVYVARKPGPRRDARGDRID